MRFWCHFFPEKLKLALCSIIIVGSCGLWIDLEAGASDDLLVLKGRLFTDQENIYQALEDVRTTVVSEITSSQENTLALWLDSAPSGVSSPVGIFTCLRMLSQVLDFWGVIPTTDPQAPSWSEVLRLVGVPRRAGKESLWGKIRQLRNTAHHLDTFVSVLGTPGDTSSETFFGLLNQVVKRATNVPLLAMIETSCHQKTMCIKSLITALLAEENRRLEEFVKSKNPMESEERPEERIMIEKLRRYLVGFPKQKVSTPELLSTLFDNFFEILREYKFTNFSTFMRMYNELSGTSSSNPSCSSLQDEERPSFYARLVDLQKSLSTQEFCLEEALDTFAPSLDSKLGQELQALRGILADELFGFIGEEAGNASAPTLRGFIDSLFNSIRRKNKLLKTNERKNLLLEHLLDTAVTFEHLISEPLCLDIHTVLKVFQEDCPEKLNEIFWLVDRPGNQDKQIAQKLEGGIEEESLLSSLHRAKKNMLSFPLLRAFGSFPPLPYPQIGGQENFTSVLSDIMEKVRETEGAMTMDEARTECFGNADGSTHESLSYWLNILSSVFHSETFDFSFMRNILPFLTYSEGTWLGRLIRLRDDYTVDPSSQFETIQALFPDVTVVLDYPQSQSFTRALWELMLEIFPIYFEKTFGIGDAKTAPQGPLASLQDHLELAVKNWERRSHEDATESLSETLEVCRRCLTWFQKKDPSFSEKIIFFLYEHIGSPDNPAPGTLWREMRDMQEGALIDPHHFSAECDTFRWHLQELVSKLQGPRDGVRHFLQFCQTAISTLRQNFEGLIKLETQDIRQLEPLLTSLRSHLLSLYSGLMEGTMGEEITDLTNDFEALSSALSLPCLTPEVWQLDNVPTDLSQQLILVSEEVVQFSEKIAEFALKKDKSFSLFYLNNISTTIRYISEEFLSSWQHYQPQDLSADEQLTFHYSVESLAVVLQQLSSVVKFL